MLLPESGKHLIDKKYNKYIDKIKLLIDIHDISYKINKKDLSLIMDKFNEFVK